MKDVFKIMYIIVDKKGNASPLSLSYQKSACIRTFLTGSRLTWAQSKKYGWKCVKVDVNITASSNLDRN